MNTRTPWLRFLLVIGAAIAVLALAACGGGDDNASNTPGASTAGASGAATSGVSSTAQATSQSTDTSDILDQLAQLGDEIDQATGKVTYQLTDSDGAVTTMTLYSKSPNSRFDSTDSSGTSSYITTPDAVYTCAENACIKTPTASGSDLGGLGLFGALFSPAYVDALVEAARSQGIDVQKSDENIAGADATCFSGTENDGTKGKFCFGDNGILLYSESTDADGSTTKIEAQSYSSDVSDSDFEPPYPVTDLGAIPTG